MFLNSQIISHKLKIQSGVTMMAKRFLKAMEFVMRTQKLHGETTTTKTF